MSDAYTGLDDLRVNPFIAPKGELLMKARFKCPMCGEAVELNFTHENIKALLRGFNLRMKGGPSP